MTCPVCEKLFASEHSVRMHRVYSGRISGPCVLLPEEKSTPRERALAYARRKQAERGPLDFICTCGQGFPSASSRGSHRTLVAACAGPMPGLHEQHVKNATQRRKQQRWGDRPLKYRCANCGQRFPSTKARGSHRASASRWDPDSPCAGTTPGQRKASYKRYWRKLKQRRYARRWRKEHPMYFIELRESRGATPRSKMVRRRKDQAPQIVPLFPHLHHGAAVSFWDEELAMDIEQERALAILEGRNPDEAAHNYRKREKGWYNLTIPLLEESA